MIRFSVVTVALLLAFVPAAAEEALPRPAGLEPNVLFWTRIYSEVDGNAGLIHDSVHLDVVYKEIRFPEGLSRRSRDRKTKAAKDQIRKHLKLLARGRRSGLSVEQSDILSRWPDDVSNTTLSAAVGNVRFQLGQADKFKAGLVRAGEWKDYIRQELVEHGVPTELTSLPHVESSYNPSAYSRIGAAGIWQFTRDTGRRYLRVDTVVDERMDPFKATSAAARLLSDNFKSTKTWPLAITSYNHGATGMRRAVRKLGTRDIDTIVRKYKSRTFGFASRNFYASFLAALEVDRNATHYFGTIRPNPPVEYTLIEMPYFYKVSSLQRALGINGALLKDHNGALRPAVWNGSKFVPKGFQLRVPRELLHQPAEQTLANIPASERLAKQHIDRYYKVRRGDTLSGIARRYGVRESQLVALNNLRSRHRIRVGQVIVLPGSAPIEVRREQAPDDGIYRVRRGDSISTIARRFDVSERDLVSLNGLRNRNMISVGQRLKIPGAVAATSTAAAPVIVASAKPAAAPAPVVATTAAKTDKPSPRPTAPTPAREAPDTNGTHVAQTSAPAPGGSPDPSDYSVHADGRISVQAAETLGHYADWLEIRASELRRLNKMKYEQDLVIGRRLRLEFSKVTPEEFERLRLEYHRSIQEEFFNAYVVADTERHVLRKGDTIWELATHKYRVPVWLLRQYNPDLDFAALPAGVAMVVPVIEPRSS